MAIGDAAAAAGLEVVPASQDLKLGYERINKKGDELAQVKTDLTTGLGLKINTSKITVSPIASPPGSPATGDVHIGY